MKKKRLLLILSVLVILGFLMIVFFKDKSDKFVYQKYDKTLKCLPESFRVSEIDYQGLIADNGLKHWKITMHNLNNNSLYEGFIVSSDESGLIMGNNVLLTTHCVEDNLPAKETDPKKTEIYQVFLYAQNNRQIEKKKALILDKYIWVNP